MRQNSRIRRFLSCPDRIDHGEPERRQFTPHPCRPANTIPLDQPFIPTHPAALPTAKHHSDQTGSVRVSALIHNYVLSHLPTPPDNCNCSPIPSSHRDSTRTSRSAPHA